MSETQESYLGRQAGDTARNIETLEAMLRVERRQVKRWRNSFASAPSPETQRALAFLGGRIAALKGAILALRKQEGAAS